MKRINSLSDLLMEELADLLNAESQLIEALPKIIEASQLSTLKLALESQLKFTKEHAKRLQDIFSHIGQNAQRVTCKEMKEFIQECEDVVNKTDKVLARDIAIIGIMQRVEQYEISGYKTANEHAEDLGHTKIVEVLNKIINEEREINFYLSELAQGMINVQAIEPESSGFYIPERKFSREGVKKKNKSMDVSRFISEGNPNIQEDSEKGKG